MGPYTYADFTSMGMGPQFTELSGCGFLGLSCVWKGIVCAGSVIQVILPILRFARNVRILENLAKFVKPSTAYKISDIIDEINKGDKSPGVIWRAITKDPDVTDAILEITGIGGIIACIDFIGDAIGGGSDSGGNGSGQGNSSGGGSSGGGQGQGSNGGGDSSNGNPPPDTVAPVTPQPTTPETPQVTTQDPPPATQAAPPPPTTQAPPPAAPERPAPSCEPYPACKA